MGMTWILSLEIPNSRASSYSNFEETTMASALFAEVFKVIPS
jgi:hypothetical protein